MIDWNAKPEAPVAAPAPVIAEPVPAWVAGRGIAPTPAIVEPLRKMYAYGTAALN